MRSALAAIVVALIAVPSARAADAAGPFTFVALGDTTYSAPADYPLYEQLIATINAAKPVFSIFESSTSTFPSPDS